MTGLELLKKRTTHHISRAKLASVLNINPSKITYWERTGRALDPAYERKVVSFLDHYPAKAVTRDSNKVATGSGAQKVYLSEIQQVRRGFQQGAHIDTTDIKGIVGALTSLAALSTRDRIAVVDYFSSLSASPR